MIKNLKLGLFGFGVVGKGLYHVLEGTKGLKAEILKICVKDPTKPRPLPGHYFTFDRNDILENPEVNVVVEMINDPAAAYEIVTAALRKGKAVVTANKTLVADNIRELHRLQEEYKAPLLYEASSCASIPIIRNLEEYYDNDTLNAVEGIFNGSTNYILSRIFSGEKNFTEALREARELGFAELDPSLDVEGHDPKYKLCIILAHAFGFFVRPEEVFHYGIQNLSDFDVRIAREKGYKIKLMAKSRKTGNKVMAYVMPQFVNDESELYKVEREFNGVIVEGAFSEHQFFVGKGAGGHPTGSAVLSDISALTYDYKYEYKKLNQNLGYELALDFEVQIYLRYPKSHPVDTGIFKRVMEEYRTPEECYIVGTIDFRNLREAPWIKRRDVNMILTSKQPGDNG